MASNSNLFVARRRPLSDIGNSLNAVPNLATLKEGAPVKTLRTTTAPGGTPSLHQPLPNPQSPGFDAKVRDPQYVSAYVADIFSHLSEKQTELTATGYMAQQQMISERMRSILIDWLVDVHNKFKLNPETLFLAVNIVDRYLERKPVSRDNLQLVGVVAMMLASKYEEIYPPEVNRFIHISANTYTREQVLTFEKQMLGALDFHLTVPTIYPFLRRGLQVIEAEPALENIARFFAEICLTDYSIMTNFKPLHIAASCISLALAQKSAGSESWRTNLEYYMKLQKEQVAPCAESIQAVAKTACSNAKITAVRKKFSSRTYGCVGKMRADEIIWA